jgi:hypothetical protein
MYLSMGIALFLPESLPKLGEGLACSSCKAGERRGEGAGEALWDGGGDGLQEGLADGCGVILRSLDEKCFTNRQYMKSATYFLRSSWSLGSWTPSSSSESPVSA